jgi:hypothetical protein
MIAEGTDSIGICCVRLLGSGRLIAIEGWQSAFYKDSV